MERVDLLPGELVHVWNLTNGERFVTYAIAGEPGSGVICINGAAALRVSVGHKIIIAAFAQTDERITPRIILVDDNNRFVKYL